MKPSVKKKYFSLLITMRILTSENDLSDAMNPATTFESEKARLMEEMADTENKLQGERSVVKTLLKDSLILVGLRVCACV